MTSLTLSENGVSINETPINEKIFTKEMVDYSAINTSDQIDHLIDWISEAKSEKETMKEDLKYLMKLKDTVIFSSVSTNEYIAKSDNEESFDEICKEILKKNAILNIT